MSIGTQISDMTLSGTLPTGSFVPFVVGAPVGSLIPSVNYRYNLGAALLLTASYSALAATNGAGLIGYVAPESDSADSTVAAQFAMGPLYAENFRLPGFTDRQTLFAAFTAWAEVGGVMELERGRVYDYGSVTSVNTPSGVLHEVTGLRGAILRGNGATLQLTSSGATFLPIILYLYNYQNVQIENLLATDNGLVNGGDSTRGAKMIVLDSDASNPTKDITVRNCRAYNMNTFFNVNPGTPGNRIDGIYIEPSCVVDTTFYGASFQGNGDNARVFFTARNVGRAYFPYGVTGHEIGLRIEDTGTATPAAQSCILVKRYAANTTNIKGWASFGGVLKWTMALVDMEHEPTAASSIIDSIDIRVQVDRSATDPNSIFVWAFRSRIDATYEELAATFTGSISNGSPTVSTLSIPIGNFVAGQGITGTGIPAATTILTVGASTLTLSANATTTNAAATLTRLTKNVWSNIRLSGDIGSLKAVKCFVGAITSYGVTLDAPLSLLLAARFTLQPGINLFRTSALNASAVYDPPSLADGAGATTTVALSGAELSDFARASFSLDLQGITLTAWVSAADTVSVRFQNESGGTLDLASGTLRVNVTKGFQA